MKIAVTGGIGVGKTSFSKLFKQEHVLYIDELCKNLYLPGSEMFDIFIKHCGVNIIVDGVIDRNILRKHYNYKCYEHEIAIINRNIKEHQDKHIVSVIDSARIIEDKLTPFDILIVVDAPYELRKQRAFQRSYMTEEIWDSIIKNQLPQEEKVKYANVIIKNDKDFDYLKEQFSEFLSCNKITF